MPIPLRPVGYNPVPVVEQDRFANIAKIIESGGESISRILDVRDRLKYRPVPLTPLTVSDPGPSGQPLGRDFPFNRSQIAGFAGPALLIGALVLVGLFGARLLKIG